MPTNLKNIPAEIASVLDRLRTRIRRYVFLEGVALVLVVLGLAFWVTMGLNYAYFRASNLELPRWFRAFLDVAAVSLVAAGCVLWIGMRVFRRMRTRALALVLERRFPELDDRLITAVEVAESLTGQETPLSYALLRRTVDDVTRAAEHVEVSDVFERRPLRRALLGASVLAVSIAAFGILNKEALANWADAFLRLKEEYWNRNTKLVALVVPENAQPHDPPREFTSELFYKHPKGGDLNLIVVVPEQDERTGKRWLVPERVQLSYELAGDRGGGTVSMSKTGEREFSYAFADQLDGMTFYIRGGDYVNRRPYTVAIVDPPAVDRVDLACDYPAYTGLNELLVPAERDASQGESGDETAMTQFVSFRQRRVKGSQIALPMETGFTLHARTNKPLTGVRIECDTFRLRLGGETGRLVVLRDDGLPLREIELPSELVRQWLVRGERAFRVEFALSSAADDELQQLETVSRVPLKADMTLRFYLEDTDRIATIEPSRLQINGIVDEEPQADLKYTGIGEHITRKARIPLAGLLRDDYGIAHAEFAFKLAERNRPIAEADPWQTRQFETPTAANAKQHTLGGEGGAGVEYFSVLPLELEIGQSLKLTVYVEDGDQLNGPHSVYALPEPQYTFKVVSDDELLSILFDKEIGLRERFVQIISEVEDTREQLAASRDPLAELQRLRSGGGAAGTVQALAGDIQTTAERAVIQVNKNWQETTGVEIGFAEILDELENNGLLTQKMVERLRDTIVNTLHDIGEQNFRDVDRAVGAFRTVHEEGRNPSAEIGRSLSEIDQMLELMRRVLAEMEDLAKFNELREELRRMIAEEEGIRERTQQELEDLLKKLQNLPID